MNQIDPFTLETVGRVSQCPLPPGCFFDLVKTPQSDHTSPAKLQINYRNHIAVNLATAHPHYDSQGNTYNMGTTIMGLSGPKYVIFKVPANASGTVVSAGLKILLDLQARRRSKTFSGLQDLWSNIVVFI